MPVEELLEALYASGFQGIYIDRWGMDEKEDRRLEEQLSMALRKAPVTSADQRRAFFSVRGFTPKGLAGKSADQLAELRAAYGKAIGVSWDHGCYDLEGVANANHRWCSASGRLSLTNPYSAPTPIEFEMVLFTGDAQTASVSFVLPSGTRKDFMAGTAGVHVTFTDAIPPGVSAMTITTTAHRVHAPDDPRELYLSIGDFRLFSNGRRIY
jgi:hypothetical protein